MIGVFAAAFGFGTAACQRNPENVQAAREDTVPGATNQNPSRPANAGKDALLTAADQAFMKKAEDRSIRERNLARVAMQRTRNSDVRDFAKMIVDDHTKDLHNIVNLMESKGIPQPKNMPEVKHEAEGMLNNLSGAAMDRAFIDAMIKDHERDIAEFTKEVRSGEDPAVRDYAAHALETLQKHLQKAQELQSKLAKNPSK
jgi:putative membrane protein